MPATTHQFSFLHRGQPTVASSLLVFLLLTGKALTKYLLTGFANNVDSFDNPDYTITEKTDLALRDLTLSIAPKQKVALCGRTGR